MKYISLTGKILLALAAAVILILFTAGLLMQDKVTDVVLSSLNKSFLVRIETGSMKLSFLRKFPRASLRMRNVVVHSSAGFRKSDFGNRDTDTLFRAESLSMEFSVIDILKGNYEIESISARTGKLNLLADSAGKINYTLTEASGSQEPTIIDLKGINLHDITAGYCDLSSSFSIAGLIRNGKIRSRISGENIDFTASGETTIGVISIDSLLFARSVPAKIELELESRKDGVTFRKGRVGIDDYFLGMTGIISTDDILDLQISGTNVNAEGLAYYLPQGMTGMLDDYNPSGRMTIDGTIKGAFTGDSNPDIEIGCRLEKGTVSAAASGRAVSDISFDGHFSNGPLNTPETSSFTFSNLGFRLGSSDYSGSVRITGMTNPVTEISLKGRLVPSELKEFFSLEKITTTGGSADIDLKLITHYWPEDTLTTDELLGLRPEGTIVFHSFAFGIKEKDILISDVNGSMYLSDACRPDKLSFIYKGHRIMVSGEFWNLPGWLAGKPVTLTASADVALSRLTPETFLRGTDDKNSEQASVADLPGNLVLDLDFRIDSLRYKGFSSEAISGSLSYKPKLLTFKSFTMKSLGGEIDGDGFLVRNASGSFVSKGSFVIRDIDVNRAFTTFGNFGQGFIKAENLSGRLSGDISILMPLDRHLKPDAKTISAEGRYTLLDGALINFEPVRQLSSFIELSELENIHFQKLENDFFIRNNTLFMPQMDVKSSAADLSVSGQHSFDNNYEYHVKMLLSQLLSKKRKANKTAQTEFGVVRDDGLGRTSLLLKVEDKGDDVKVSYDLKAAVSGIRNNLKQEKQTLKTILNEEYGQNKDVKTVTTPAAKKPKVSITWDDKP